MDTSSPLAARHDRLISGGLLTLAVQDFLLMAALFSQVQPHPPENVGPFIGALLALTLRAAWSLRTPGRWSHALAAAVALAHLPNFGPHKFLLPQAGVIWPMVTLGLVMLTQVAVLAGARWWQQRGAAGAQA